MSAKSSPKLKQVKNIVEKKPVKKKLKLYETITSRRRRELHFGPSSTSTDTRIDTRMKNNNEFGGPVNWRTSKPCTPYLPRTPQRQKPAFMVAPSIKKSVLDNKNNMSSSVKIFLSQVKLPLKIRLDWRSNKYHFVDADSNFPDVEEMTRYYPNYDGDVNRSYEKLTGAEAGNSGNGSKKVKVPKSIKIGRIFDPYMQFWPIEIDQEAIDIMDNHLEEQIRPKLPPQPPVKKLKGILKNWT